MTRTFRAHTRMREDGAQHQAFGNGPQVCQRSHIARRMLADILLVMLFDLFPDMALSEPEKLRFYGFGIRG